MVAIYLCTPDILLWVQYLSRKLLIFSHIDSFIVLSNNKRRPSRCLHLASPPYVLICKVPHTIGHTPIEYSGIPYCMANDVRDCTKATPLVSVQILVWQLGCCHIPHSGKDYELLKTNETYINQYDASFPITEVINYFIDEFFAAATSGARSIGDYNSISCWLSFLSVASSKLCLLYDQQFKNHK